MLKRKLTPLVLLLSFAFIGARCYQYMYLIDSTTGYYTPHVFNTLMVVFAAVCCAFLAAPLLLRRSCFSVNMIQTSSNTFFCIVNLAACLAFAAVTTIGVYQYATGEKTGLADILTTVFALLTVIYFAYIFINGGSPDTGSGMHLFLIGPIGFTVVRLTVDFNRLTMNANVSGYKYLLLGLSAVICFFLMFGRYQLEGTAVRGAYVFARLTVFLLGAASVSPLIMHFLPGVAYEENISIAYRFIDVITILYAWSFISVTRIDCGQTAHGREELPNEQKG